MHSGMYKLEEIISYSSLPKSKSAPRYAKFREKVADKFFYLSVLVELERAVSLGDYGTFAKLICIVKSIYELENPVKLKFIYNNSDNPIKSTNLFILSCKYNQVEILKHILVNMKIVSLMNGGEEAVQPGDEDDLGHNSFYYAICSENIELLLALIESWPDDYFEKNTEELDEILSATYEGIKLRNILISNEIEMFVESKLLKLRFSTSSGVSDIDVIKERAQLVIQDINLLVADYYLNTRVIDEKFLYKAKFVAKNIDILKRHLKSTYDKLPWEEMEFCLIIFVCSYIKQQEINLFVRVLLDKDKILYYLKTFANLIEKKDIFEGLDVSKIPCMPRLKQEDVVLKIIKNNQEFEDLYHIYQQIKDIYSLNKISNYVNLALSAIPEDKNEHLVIIRCLQVISEHLKSTLESPNLSRIPCDLILLSLQKCTREAIMDMRDSLSHAQSLSKRIEMEKNMDIQFWIGVQKDLKIIGVVISDILFKAKFKLIRMLLENLKNCKNFEEIKEIVLEISHTEIDTLKDGYFEVMEVKTLEKYTMQLSNIIGNKTIFEIQLFNKINNIIKSQKSKEKSLKTEYIIAFASLKSLMFLLEESYRMENNTVRGIKSLAKVALEKISSKIDPYKIQEIVYLTIDVFDSFASRVKHDNDKLDELRRVMLQIYIIVEFTLSDIKCIKELKNKLNRRNSSISNSKRKHDANPKEDKKLLEEKTSELKSILDKYELDYESNEFFSFYNRNKKLQAIIEMLLLDIMSILGESKFSNLKINTFFLDDNTPLLTGINLRNHLAHCNNIIDLVPSNSLFAIIFYAKKVISENAFDDKTTANKVKHCLSKLKCSYNKGLIIIKNHTKMFFEIKHGNLEALKVCLKKGADINGRDINSSTTLHCASESPSLDIVKFILSKNLKIDARNREKENCLHVAARYGKKDVVEFFVKDKCMYVNEINCRRKTPLHLAAQNGHIDTVVTLMQNNAKVYAPDNSGLPPIHCALRNGHIIVAELLIEKYPYLKNSEASGGFTPLHEAAERGYIEFVKFFLKNGVNVNVKNDRKWMPLHAAALNGYLDVVKILISKGADINARVMNGCTPLHYAVENGHQEIVQILLKHRVNVNVPDKLFKNTPLHYGAKNGYVCIAKALLKNKANVGACNVYGMTPLHFAAGNGHLDITVMLLKHHSDVNAKDASKSTALHFAVENGHKAIVDLLIKNNASINDRNEEDFTPLHIAALKDHQKITELLIKYNAKINSKTKEGLTPLHIAAEHNSCVVIDLIKYNAEVNATDDRGCTPLHLAALNGNINAVTNLIENNGKVNVRSFDDFTPLHASVVSRSKDVIHILIRNKAQINTKTKEGNTPLHTAAQIGFKEAVEILIKNKADINAKNEDGDTPLYCSLISNNEDIVIFLVSKHVDIDIKDLSFAVLLGSTDILKMLLKQRKLHVKSKYEKIEPLLHLVAIGVLDETMMKQILKGENVIPVEIENSLLLLLASRAGREGVVKILIANDANVNITDIEDGMTPLHLAAAGGHINIVKILIANNAKINIQDNKNRTPIELAVAHGHLQVVKALRYKTDINYKGHDSGTLLHIAAYVNKLDIIKYLISEGSYIHATLSSGSKPIHVAAEAGLKATVENFLNSGSSINDLGMDNRTILHYAIKNLEVMMYLIDLGVDVNSKDDNGLTPIHIAAYVGSKDAVLVLLTNGAFYNVLDKYCRTPLNITNDNDVINLLASTENLFTAVKCTKISEVVQCIEKGAFVNAKNKNGSTPLHFSAWKGDIETVNVLLINKSNPNIVNSKGFMPLHYASKSCHMKVVTALLRSGAIYNCLSNCHKTPLDFATDTRIIELLHIVDEAFENVKNCTLSFNDNLYKMKDIDSVKAVVNACNREEKTLVVVALLNNFPNVERLKEILQDNVSTKINFALNLLDQHNYEDALNIFKNVCEKRTEIFGPDNPGTLDINVYISKVLFKQGAYNKVLDMLEIIYNKQKRMLGANSQCALNTRSFMALVLHMLGKDTDALCIYQEILPMQKQTLGSNHTDTLDTQLHMGLVLDRLERYEEALAINKEVFKKRNDENHLSSLEAQNNIAMVLSNMGQYDEALEVFKETYEKKKVDFGANSSDTLRTLHNIAYVLFKQEKIHESLEAFKDVFKIQKNILGCHHADTLNTQFNIANILFDQGKSIGAFKTYKEVLCMCQAIWGRNHPTILEILKKVNLIKYRLEAEGIEESDILQHSQKDIIVASYSGDIKKVQQLLRSVVDVNDTDDEGRTPLHYACDSGHAEIVKILLENGANVTQITNKGNTPLHSAASKGNNEIVKLLLEYVSYRKQKDFVNAQTTIGGNASLHVAAKNGFMNIVLSLLQCGAIFNIRNAGNKTPLDLSTNQNVTNILELVEEIFQKAKYGNIQIIDKLHAVNYDEFLAVTNAHNEEGITLLNFLINNKHKNVSSELLKLI